MPQEKKMSQQPHFKNSLQELERLPIAIDAQGAARGLEILWSLAEISMMDFISTQRTLSTKFN
jgi:hypothetical protein